MEEINRFHAINTFEKLVQNIKEADIVIPTVDKIMTLNNQTVVLAFYDRFFAVFEKTVENSGERLSCVALGEGKIDGFGCQLTLIDIRYMLDQELFKEGVKEFLNMLDVKIEGMMVEELDIPGNLSHGEIIGKIVETYRNVSRRTIH